MKKPRPAFLPRRSVFHHFREPIWGWASISAEHRDSSSHIRGNVDAHLIKDFQRPNRHTKPHGLLIHSLPGPAFDCQPYSFIEVWEEHAIDEKAWTISDDNRCLAKFAATSSTKSAMVSSFVAGAADDFHEVHFVNGIEEVQPRHALGMRSRIGQPLDRQG